MDRFARFVIRVEANLFEPGTDGRIEGAVGLPGESHRKRDNFKEQRADPNRRADAIEKPHDLARAIEAGADALDGVEPR